MGGRTGLFVCLIVVVLALLKGARVSMAATYAVGDSLGWRVPTNSSNYSTWASTKRFCVNDTLTFNWTGSHTVEIVHTADEYDNCTKEAAGTVLDSTPVIVPLETNGSYYFLCTIADHCERGQKFGITVLTRAPSSSASSLTVGAFTALLSPIIVFLINYI